MLDRLSVVDEIFLRAHKGLGTPIAMQGLLLTDGPVDRYALEAAHAQLRRGTLGRRVVPVRNPGARARWVRSTHAYPIVYSRAANMLDWADRQGDRLDPSRGPGWRLSVCESKDRSLISLTCSHVLADARGMIEAVDAALREMVEPPDILRTSDFRDAAHIWGIVAREFRPKRGEHVPARPVRTESGSAVTACVRIPARPFDAHAHRFGISPNSLFVQIVTSILFRSGYRERVGVSLPIDTRTPGEPIVGNALAMGFTEIGPEDSPATIHDACRAGLGRRMTGPSGIPPEFLHLLPDRLAYRATGNAGQLDVLCSNIGTWPPSFMQIGVSNTIGVAARAIHPGLQRLPRTRLSGYLSRSPEHYVLSLVSMDPARISTRTQLVDHAKACIPVPATPWL